MSDRCTDPRCAFHGDGTMREGSRCPTTGETRRDAGATTAKTSREIWRRYPADIRARVRDSLLDSIARAEQRGFYVDADCLRAAIAVLEEAAHG